MLLRQAGWQAGRPRLLFQSFHHSKTRTRNVVEVDQHSVSWPGAGCSSEGAATHRILICKNLTSPETLRKRLLTALPSPTLFPCKGWEYSLTFCTREWFHSHLLVATDKQLMGFAGRHTSAWTGTMGTTEATLEFKRGEFIPWASAPFAAPRERFLLIWALQTRSSPWDKHLQEAASVTLAIVKSHTSPIPTRSTHTMDTEGMLCTFSPPHTLQAFLSLATAWDTQSPQRPTGFLLGTQHWWEKKAPCALHACLKEAQRGCRDKTFEMMALRVQTQAGVKLSQLRPRWPVLGFRQVPGWTPWCCAQAVRVPAPRAWWPWCIRYYPLQIHFLSVSSLNLTDAQKISPWATKSQFKTKQTKPKPTCLLTRLQNLFPGTRKSKSRAPKSARQYIEHS